ncbi:MAG: hypothetical protein FJX89_03225 [Bacteroidetes bacterium]|nr:hypothetical protein [Bacteroidota bacterium]
MAMHQSAQTHALHCYRHFPEADRMENALVYDRYQRQLSLKGFGLEAQQKLLHARVLVVGAGGLGCPVLQYLAAAGIGQLGVVDPDRVSLSNLPRQVLFSDADIGRQKVDVVRERLQALNPALQLETWPYACDAAFALDIFPHYDLVVDTCDNFPTRYLVNDGCWLTGRPLVHAAVSEYEGQVAVFNLPDKLGIPGLHYRHVFPSAPSPGEVRDCAEAGVLGMLPGIIGCMQSFEVVKVITGIGEPLRNRLLTYDTLRHRQLVVNILPASDAFPEMPTSAEDYLRFDYGHFCGLPQYAGIEVEASVLHPDMRIIDVREPGAWPTIGLVHEYIPLSQLEGVLQLSPGEEVLFVCRTGRRSLQAALLMKERFPLSRSYSLKGGVQSLSSLKKTILP